MNMDWGFLVSQLAEVVLENASGGGYWVPPCDETELETERSNRRKNSTRGLEVGDAVFTMCGTYELRCETVAHVDSDGVAWYVKWDPLRLHPRLVYIGDTRYKWRKTPQEVIDASRDELVTQRDAIAKLLAMGADS